MIDNKNIAAFVNCNYVPFKKSQCVQRLIIIWVLSIPICFLGYNSILWAEVLGILNLAITAFFITLILKFSRYKVARFLCDGIFCLQVAIVLNITSYRIMTLLIGENWFLFIFLMFLLLICIVIFLLVVFSRIKADKYSATSSHKISALPVLGGMFGVLAARIFLGSQTEYTGVLILSFVLLILSFLMGIASINILKAALYKKLK